MLGSGGRGSAGSDLDEAENLARAALTELPGDGGQAEHGRAAVRPFPRQPEPHGIS